VKWRERGREAGVRAPKVDLPWVVLAADETGEQMAAEIERRGACCLRLVPAATYGATSRGFGVPADSRDGLARALHELAPHGAAGVVHAWPLGFDWSEEPDDLAGAHALGCMSLLHLAQALSRRRVAPPHRLWTITRGAQAVCGSEPVDVRTAPLWGMGRTLAHEHPELWGGLVDLDPLCDAHDVRAIVDELFAPNADTNVAFRGVHRLVARIDAACPPVVDTARFAIDPHAAYAVTGAFGALGPRVCAWLADRGARSLLLVGRSAPSAAAESEIARLRASGVRVEIALADVGDRAQLERALARAAGIRGIVHVAGVRDDAIAMNTTWERFARVLSPKLEGAWNLRALAMDRALDFVVLFSSLASILGSPGQVAYAAANAALDAIAADARARGLPFVSVSFGPWEGRGMAADVDRRRFAAAGVRALDPQRALAALESAIASGAAHAIAADVDWASSECLSEC
jgi:NAD(P)-dependent dehydrogenase (short-subunit alcohol dehydrogenase family)